MVNLYNQFLKLRDDKNSLIILGLDPKSEEQREKILNLSLIKENLIGFKPNLAFYQDDNGRKRLKKISQNSGSNLIRILDLKSPDGAATNTAALNEYASYFEHVTIAPGAGCIEETIEEAQKKKLNTISMGAMSFPGVLREINLGLPLFKQRVDRAIKVGTSAFVLGATSYIPENKIEETMLKYRKLDSDKAISKSEVNDDELINAFINRNKLFKYILEQTTNKEILYLVPGFGRQGGNLEYFLESGIDLNRCMINAGSDILKADNSKAALSEMNNEINQYRK